MYEAYEVKEIADTEGLEETICDLISPESISDPELAKMWEAAREALTNIRDFFDNNVEESDDFDDDDDEDNQDDNWEDE